jgi:lysophospholipase L1-like esterase
LNAATRGGKRRLKLLLIAALAVVAVAACVWQLRRDAHQRSLTARLNDRVPLPLAHAADCLVPTQTRPLHLLVLGQSNAANHGERAAAPSPLVTLVTSAGCALVHDPLPGATARGASIWSPLPQALAEMGVARPLRFSVLAVDASLLADWVAPASPLRAELVALLSGLRQKGHLPDLVLWQQGEADARQGTLATDYEAGIRSLDVLLKTQGVKAPMLLALSTRCRSEPGQAVRQAIGRLTASGPMLAGPDTDTLAAPEMRHDGCHFSASGQQAAARLWAQALVAALPLAPGR